MCVDLPGAVSQVPVPPVQSDHIACGRDVSGFLIVSVALTNPNRHPVTSLVVHAHLRLRSSKRPLLDKLPREAHPVADTARPLLPVRM